MLKKFTAWLQSIFVTHVHTHQHQPIMVAHRNNVIHCSEDGLLTCITFDEMLGQYVFQYIGQLRTR